MNNLLEIEDELNRKKPQKSVRYRVRECPTLDGDAVYNAVVITLEDINTGKLIKISNFSEFFFQREIINLEKNSRLNSAKLITAFLNSIFFEREFYERSCKIENVINIKAIENLRIEDGNIFLNDYKYGRVGKPILKDRSSIQAAEKALTRFYYFLYKNNKCKMKYLNRNNFKFKDKSYIRDGRSDKKQVLISPFKIIYPHKKSGNRLENISFYALTEFIKLALEHYPMIALGIVLQAFAGLRKGEVPNVTWDNISWIYDGDKLRRFSIDLRVKKQLRSDGMDVGEIKSPAIANVHPAFLDYFNLIFKEHKKYIAEKFKKRNKYGAMFMNRDGEAMTDRSYEYAFNELVEMLISNLARTGIPAMIGEANIMMEKSFTTHTLRFFFSKYISRLKGTNVFELAMFRRDTNLNSAFRYIKENPFIIDNIIKSNQDDSMRKDGLYMD